MDKKITFTKDELYLLYEVCVNYVDDLLEMMKSIPNITDEETKELSDKAEESQNLVRKIEEYL